MFSKLAALLFLAAISAACLAGTFAQASAGWRTYRSADYGFTIAYPTDMRIYNSARGENAGGYAPICSDTTIACFGYTGQDYKGTNFEGAGIAINVLRDAKTEQQCRTLGSAEYPQPTARSETIHGILFHVGKIGEGGMSHSQAVTAYRTLYQNVCFEIAAQINTVSIGVYDPGTIKEFDPAKLQKLFDEMVHTLQFVGPVKDGANWKVSRDTGCGTFEYPADATLRATAQNFLDRPGSDRITCSSTFSYRGREYTLAVKAMVGDPVQTDQWLRKSGYPPLENTHVSGVSQIFTDQQAGPYHYVYSPGQIFIFSFSGADHRVIDPGNDPVYRHWLASFKTI